MNEQFKQWIVDRHVLMNTESRNILLESIRRTPRTALETIEASLDDWAYEFTRLGGPCIRRGSKDAEEVLEALDQHFSAKAS